LLAAQPGKLELDTGPWLWYEFTTDIHQVTAVHISLLSLFDKKEHHMNKISRYTVITALLTTILLLSGCAMCIVPSPVDINNPLKRVAVLPFRNDTTDIDGPNVMRAKMIEILEHRSYVIKDIKETDQILRDQMGITLGGQLELTTAKKLGETLGVEGVLYGTLMDFDETTTGLYNVKKVRGKFKLVNAMTGQVVWERGLGVRAEQKMSGAAGSIASIAAKVADARDKEVPWVTIESSTSEGNNVGKAFAIGLGTKLLSKAFGKHLDSESKELARRVTENLPWGPGTTVASTVPPPPAPKVFQPEVKMPEPPSFGYMDWEGKRDFTAVIYSTSINKGKGETASFEMPLAIAGPKFRIDMDLSKMMKDDARQSPLSKMAMISRGDKKTGFTLYPNSLKFMVNKEKEDAHNDRPKVEKTKVGNEMIGKYPTEKFKVRITYKDGKSEEGFIWNAIDLDGMTIKSEVENKDYKVTTEVRNILLKTPSATLFEIPADYTEAKDFMELMMTDKKNK